MHPSLQHTEIWLFLEALHRQWGYDFRGYSSQLLVRRLHRRMKEEGCETISALQGKMLRSRHCLEAFLQDMSIEVTDWFRDPGFFSSLTSTVFPRLATYPTLRVWVAGCASGQEVYSLAILLHEADLLAKTRIYATDISTAALQEARTAHYSLGNMKDHQKSYIAAGGRGSFQDNIEIMSEHFTPLAHISDRIVYAQHNLAMDDCFNQFQLILCRNVLIYFGHDLQKHVHDSLHRSLEQLGVLGLGSDEHLRNSPHLAEYERLIEGQPLYRRI